MAKRTTTSKMAASGRKGGRPSRYTPKLVDAICARLETGEPMAQICRDDGMPAVRTVTDWIEQKPDVSASIARARLLGFDAIAAEALRIADTCRIGETVKMLPDGKVERRRSDMVERARLQVDTRLKLLAKWDPKRYGERLDLNHSGAITLEQLVTGAGSTADE